jgi:hypothetical protein
MQNDNSSYSWRFSDSINPFDKICAENVVRFVFSLHFYLIPFYRNERKVRVNCHFCDTDSMVEVANRNAFICCNCDQYNGFTEVCFGFKNLYFTFFCLLLLIIVDYYIINDQFMFVSQTGDYNRPISAHYNARLNWRSRPLGARVVKKEKFDEHMTSIDGYGTNSLCAQCNLQLTRKQRMLTDFVASDEVCFAFDWCIYN